MSRADELRSELAAAELEEEFLKAKKAFQSGKLSFDKYREVKEKFHAARVAHREAREAATPGEGTVRPATVRAKAKANSTGGAR